MRVFNVWPRLSHATLDFLFTTRRVVYYSTSSTFTNFTEIGDSMSSDQKEQKTSPVPTNEKGEYKGATTAFRNWITADGEFQPEKSRYHLYVSLACPWASRTLVTRKLKGLEDTIGVTVVDWLMGEKGWFFSNDKPKTSLDTVNNCKYMREIYELASPGYNGRVSVPVLWDKKNRTIVNNESAEIMRMFNKEFNAFSATKEQGELDLCPPDLLKDIDEVNSWIYENINIGVYKCGFATSQEAYDDAAPKLFAALDRAEEVLSKSRYLCGDRMTEADIRLFTTLVRFDTVYAHHFKCNKKRIVDYPNLWGFTRDIFQTPGVSETVDQEHIQKHYQVSHVHINPNRIVAIGPDLDFNSPHGRDVKFSK
ncbi:glutathionyl-hydroquinone reductase YqjG-like [Lytechinus pictus]|uniref:glutathionyl-hydroquinone reductase YqjG-like n=1 Tax=Lytechinus pictus TaxID=7653 RepID=UPI0030BA240A